MTKSENNVPRRPGSRLFKASLSYFQRSRSKPESCQSPRKLEQPKSGGRKLLLLEEEANAAGSQLQSCLMRLPREIRDQIWTECLGNMEFSLNLKINNARMRLSRTAFPDLRVFNTPSPWPLHPVHRGLMCLPLTCRQMQVRESCTIRKFLTIL